MPYEEIEALLKHTMGLKITTIGQAALNRAINRRMRAIGLNDNNAYIKKIKASPKELKELVEEVVIPETWFFRDKNPFSTLVDCLAALQARTDKKIVARILSVPCSTGEEPYSICMSLLESKSPEYRFQVDAVDISSKSIARAQKAVFSDHSFRGNNLDYQSKYFQKNEEGYVLNKTVRKKVQFLQGNILNPSFMARLGAYDAIFCRNLLIYLDEFSQKRAIATLDRLLSPDGILFVGHAEAGILAGSKFVPSPYPKAFAYLKNASKDIPSIKQEFPWQKVLPNRDNKTDKAPSFFEQREYPASPKPEENSGRPQELLETAHRMADQGKLNEAESCCEKYLLNHGPSAHAYFLLGLIYDISGDLNKAKKLLKKAVYLEPDHLEGLILLSLLAERSGDRAGAENYKRRSKRIRKKE